MKENQVLSVQNLCKTYPDFVLSDIDLQVNTGEVVGFIGENGAGKTTTLNCILGITFPDAGSVDLLGEEIAKCNSQYVGDKRFAEARQDVGTVFDACAFPDEFTVSYARQTCKRAYSDWDDDLFTRLTAEPKLDADKRVSDLSRGMGMKLSLACALSHHPKLLILDEATAGLDPMAREEALDLIRQHVDKDGCGVLMSSHITSDLSKIADRIVCINEGQVLFNKLTDEITDIAGIARCTKASFAEISNVLEGEIRYVRNAHSIDVLVPNRIEFDEAFPEVPVDRATIDEYMALMLRGEVL